MKLQHLLDIQQLSQNEILILLDSANKMLHDFIFSNKTTKIANGTLCANLFFEPSTRTCASFEIAAHRLGALTITPNLQFSSLLKGESVLDTVNTMEAMGAKIFVIRHKQHGIMQTLSNNLKSSAHIINAGEGWLHHPTQALLDLFTIQKYKPALEKLSIAIVGDLFHSRVAHSLIKAFNIMGVTDLRLVSPELLKPEPNLCSKAHIVTHDIAKGLNQADVVICLRLQKERMSIDRTIPEKEFIAHYQVTNEAMRFAKRDAIVMHPGPVNRGIEITSQVADSPQSVIFQQVQNGVAVRMALLNAFLEIPH